MSTPRLKPVLEKELHRIVDCHRKEVRVNRQALVNLLVDHSALWSALGVKDD